MRPPPARHEGRMSRRDDLRRGGPRATAAPTGSQPRAPAGSSDQRKASGAGTPIPVSGGGTTIGGPGSWTAMPNVADSSFAPSRRTMTSTVHSPTTGVAATFAVKSPWTSLRLQAHAHRIEAAVRRGGEGQEYALNVVPWTAGGGIADRDLVALDTGGRHADRRVDEVGPASPKKWAGWTAGPTTTSWRAAAG